MVKTIMAYQEASGNNGELSAVSLYLRLEYSVNGLSVRNSLRFTSSFDLLTSVI